jgi:hypothetical protein
VRGPLLSHIGERAMTAVADQTHNELATTIGIASGSPTKLCWFRDIRIY